MGEREALLAAVSASPADDLPRLVYADWLDEHGEPERAEFIRVQCAIEREPLARGPLSNMDRLWRREAELLADPSPLLDPEDRDLLTRAWIRPTLKRGFLTAIEFPDYEPGRFDPPRYPVAEVAGVWSNLCDLFARRPPLRMVECPGWFRVEIRRVPVVELPRWLRLVRRGRTLGGGWEVTRLRLNVERCELCGRCGGSGRVGFLKLCPDCVQGRLDVRREFPAPDYTTLANRVLRVEVARDLFGPDHPLFG